MFKNYNFILWTFLLYNSFFFDKVTEGHLKDCEFGKLDLVIILDTSKSVGEENFPKCINFIENIVSSLPIASESVRVALVRYSNEAQVVSYLDDNMTKHEKKVEVSRIEYIKGSTYTNLALQITNVEVLTPERGDRSDVADLVILITDGVSSDVKKTRIETRALKQRDNLKIFTIGVGDEIDNDELVDIATNPNYSVSVESFEQLTQIITNLTKLTCLEGVNQNGQTTESSNETTSTSGKATYDETTSQSNFQSIQSNEETTQSNEETTQSNARKLDLVIILDTFKSGDENFFFKRFNYTESLLELLSDESEYIRTSLVLYSRESQVVTYLNESTTKEMKLKEAAYFKNNQGYTKTNLTLPKSILDVLTFLKGDRSDAANFAIVVTDDDFSNQSLALKGIGILPLDLNRCVSNNSVSVERFLTPGLMADTLMYSTCLENVTGSYYYVTSPSKYWTQIYNSTGLVSLASTFHMYFGIASAILVLAIIVVAGVAFHYRRRRQLYNLKNTTAEK